ncbi:unnamed protein product, partial [Brassica rapa subsp. trilocularis]
YQIFKIVTFELTLLRLCILIDVVEMNFNSLLLFLTFMIIVLAFELMVVIQLQACLKTFAAKGDEWARECR